MFDEPHLLNDHEKVESTYAAALQYLKAHPTLYKKIASYLWAYYEIGELIPQTLDNFGSGHYFPYSESYCELENSYELALHGFYNHAFAALRSVLELGLLGVYFAVHDTEHIDVRPWFTSQEQTPRRKEIFKRLRELESFQQFDKRFKLEDRILKTFDRLDRYVHTRGARYSGRALRISNVNQFNDKSLRLYFGSMFTVTADLMIIILLKYPIGLQGLPLDEKFGLEGPAGGYLQDNQVRHITSVLVAEERDFLQKISDDNLDVQTTVLAINNLPDLTRDEWEQQAKRLDESIDMGTKKDTEQSIPDGIQ